MVEKAQCVTFVSTIVLIFILSWFKKVIICSITHMPPKDINEQHSTVDVNVLATWQMLMQPVVISNSPSKKDVTSIPSVLNHLGSMSQTIVQNVLNSAIRAPTISIEFVASITLENTLSLCKVGQSCFSEQNNFLYASPLKMQPNTWLVSNIADAVVLCRYPFPTVPKINTGLAVVQKVASLVAVILSI